MAGDFVKSNKQIIIVPIATFLVSLVYYMLWIIISLYLFSIGTVTEQSQPLPYDQVKASSFVQALGFVHLFALFWNSAFLIGVSEFIISGAVCEWYLKQGKERKLDVASPVRESW